MKITRVNFIFHFFLIGEYKYTEVLRQYKEKFNKTERTFCRDLPYAKQMFYDYTRKRNKYLENEALKFDLLHR